MATLTQMENFEAAIAALDKTIKIDTSDAKYIRLEFCRPDTRVARVALRTLLRNLGEQHGLEFDGFDEDGYPCFINEEE